MLRRARLILQPGRRIAHLATVSKSYLEILGQRFPCDNWTNITPSIISKTNLKLHLKPAHPLSTLRGLVESAYPDLTHVSSISPLVSPNKNFDDLSFPVDHPGRSVTDSYYVNKDLMLRTHTSAHEVEMFRRGETKWLLTADVYRRDEIDALHYPIFHQIEGARIFNFNASGMKEVEEDNERLSNILAQSHILIEDIPHISLTNPVQPVHDPLFSEQVSKNLKLSLNHLLLKVFGDVAGISKNEPLRVRWIEAYFPFTSPSFEVEVFFQGRWLEILGSGVIRQSTLDTASA
jgi:phenylalanyl-tRNA synthetase alpha chain